jgi:ABC-type sugar transport system, permease component
MNKIVPDSNYSENSHNKWFEKIYLSIGVKYLIIIFALLSVLLPLLYLVSNSLKPDIEMYNSKSFLPSHITWDHFSNLFRPENNTFLYIKNSFVVAIVSTLLSLLFGSLAAYAISRLPQSKILMAVTTLIVVVRFYPKITIVLPYFLLVKTAGLLDTTTAIIISHTSILIPVTVLIMSTFYAQIPKQIEEAAMIDGASVYKTYFQIILPTTTTGMAAAAILTGLTSWNEFLMASSVASTKALTLPIRISGFITDKGTDWGAMSSLSIVTILPVLILVLLTQKYLVEGLVAGAVKG